MSEQEAVNLAIRAVLCVNSGAFLLQPYTSFGQVLLCQFAFSLADADGVSWPAFAVHCTRCGYPCGTAPSARLSRYCVHCTAAEAVSFDRISEAVFTNEHNRQLHFGSMIVGGFPPNKLALHSFGGKPFKFAALCAVTRRSAQHRRSGHHSRCPHDGPRELGGFPRPATLYTEGPRVRQP